MSEIALEISGAAYAYREEWTGKSIRALEPLNLKIKVGECFGYLGHNGAGKTTTIKCILGLITPTHGVIKIFGENSKSPHSRSSIGYVPEHPYFYDHLTVEELLTFYGRLSGIGHSLQERIDQGLSRLGLLERKRAKMRTLSKGLTQKVAIVQALLHDPKLIILDEPFSGLDPIGRREVRRVILEEKEKGKTIFMCSHVLSDVELLCDRASVLSKGRLKGIVELSACSFERFQVISKGESVITCESQEELRATLEKLISEKTEILGVERISKTLEERFVELINE